MAKWTAEKRKKLPLDRFGDPDNRLFPIEDQDDVDSAARLIGKAANKARVKARIIAIARRLGLQIPDAWKEKAAASMSGGEPRLHARFDLKASTRVVEGDQAVYPNALLWVADEYPDKQYAMTPEENWLAVESFSPVSGNIEHTDFLAGRACQVRSIHLDADDPALLRGVVSVPLALDELLAPAERGLSCEWDRDSKCLQGLALTTNPRVPVAALMNNQALATLASTTSTRHDTSEGQRTMQAVHDLAAKSGALCSQENPNGTQRYGSSYFVSAHERAAMQSLHDTAVEHGAKCSDMGKASTYSAAMSVLFAGKRHSQSDQADIQRIHDLTNKLGAACASSDVTAPSNIPPTSNPATTFAAPAAPRTGRISMNRKLKIRDRLSSFAFWHQMGPEMREAAIEQGVPLQFDEEEFDVVDMAAQDAAKAAREEELAAIKAERDAAIRDREQAKQEKLMAVAQRQQSEASHFVDGVILGGVVMPHEKEQLIALFVQAAQDDAASGPVTFADGKQTSRVEQFKASIEARTPHGLTREQIDPRQGVRVIPAAQFAGGAEADPETVKHTATKDGEAIPETRAQFLLSLAGVPQQPSSNGANPQRN